MTIQMDSDGDYMLTCDTCGTIQDASNDWDCHSLAEVKEWLVKFGWRPFTAGRVTMHECEACITETETETQNDEDENDDDDE